MSPRRCRRLRPARKVLDTCARCPWTRPCDCRAPLARQRQGSRPKEGLGQLRPPARCGRVGQTRYPHGEGRANLRPNVRPLPLVGGDSRLRQRRVDRIDHVRCVLCRHANWRCGLPSRYRLEALQTGRDAGFYSICRRRDTRPGQQSALLLRRGEMDAREAALRSHRDCHPPHYRGPREARLAGTAPSNPCPQDACLGFGRRRVRDCLLRDSAADVIWSATVTAFRTPGVSSTLARKH